jgi:hypothetical protein
MPWEGCRSPGRFSPRVVPSCERSGGGGEQDSIDGGTQKDVIAPPPGELFSETNDNSVVILLTYGTARVLFAGDAEAREEYVAGDPYTGSSNGHQHSETTRTLSQGSAPCSPRATAGCSSIVSSMSRSIRLWCTNGVRLGPHGRHDVPRRRPPAQPRTGMVDASASGTGPVQPGKIPAMKTNEGHPPAP